ncbi:MAG: diguanylate cyclase domain-containing protein [Methylococcaceae bacterium]
MTKKLIRIFLDNILLLLIYYLAGHLSMLFLSIPPSNAAAIWPPTGISLAAVLLRGYWVLPAVFIADLVIAIEIFGFNDHFSIVFSLMVGFQALLAAWIGAWLIHRFVGNCNLLIENKVIILFIVLGGPVSMILPTAFAIAVEYWLKIVSTKDLFSSFFTWWFGGVIGVIIFAPVTLILFSRPVYRPRVVFVAIPLVILFILLVGIFNFTKTSEQQRLEHVFGRQALALNDETEAKIDTLLHELRSVKTFINTVDKLEDYSFAVFCQNILVHRPEIAGLAWVPWVGDSRRSSVKSTVKRDAFELKNEYSSSQLVEPSDEYLTIIAMDIASDERWRLVLEQAKKSAEPKILLPVTLLIDGIKRKITVILMAVYTNVQGTGETEHGNLRGYVLLMLPFQNVMNNAITQAKSQDINLKITGVGGNHDGIGVLETNHYQFDMVKQIQHFGVTLKFTYFPDDGFINRNSSVPVGWVFIIGLSLTGLFGFTLLSITGQTAQTQKRVEEKTKALNAERQFLGSVLNSVQEGIIACDVKGDLTVFNHAAEIIYGKKLKQNAMEQWSDDFEFKDLNGVTLLNKGENFLLKLLKTQQVEGFEFNLISANGSTKVMTVNAAQVVNDKKQMIGAVASFQDITLQKNYINELKRLSWAVEYSPACILMTDKMGNIEYVNHKFVETTGYTLAEIEGKTPRILSSGKTPVEDYQLLWKAILAGNEWRGEMYNQKKNGEHYWSRQLIAPIKNDQQQVTHFVAIQEDITEEKLVVDALSHQASHDDLTGLLNRRECEKRLDQVIQSARIQKSQHAFCFLDLDRFKIVNDSCGHLAGDHLLREVSELFDYKIRQRDTLARLGGDEFGIIMEHCSLEQAEIVANKICQAIEEYHFIWEGQQFKIGVSIGLVGIDASSENFTKVISLADEACYTAKRTGRGRVSCQKV